MSSNMNQEEHDPVANLNMQPARGILKSAKSVDEPGNEARHERSSSLNHCPTSGMTRSESKSHKIPHFDEMNIIATYHPADKDYGHMKIEEPKTPYAPNDMIDEEIDHEPTTGIDPAALAQRLKESTVPSAQSTHMRSDRISRRSIDEGVEPSPEELEHRKQFETHRKQHYNEFEIVRLRKKEIEDELRALEQDEQHSNSGKGNANISSSVDSIKPILVHHHSKDSSHHHVHVDIDDQDDHTLTPEERERKQQFELKRKKHYNEFRTARLADQADDDVGATDKK